MIEAARHLGLRRVLPKCHRPILRLEALLPRPEMPFFRRIGQEFGALAHGSTDRSRSAGPT